ncbi:MAG: hypothetical protein AB1796_06050 [Bacillota bacterium]
MTDKQAAGKGGIVMKRIGLFLLANLLVLTTIIIVTTARPEFRAAILQSYLKVRALVSPYIKMRAGAS